MRQRLILCSLLFTLLGLSACGGKVLVETTGNPGGEGGSGASGSGSNVGGGQAQNICDKFCDISQTYACDPGSGSCASDCAMAFDTIPADCKDEYATFLECLVASIPQSGCDFTQVCTSEIFALGVCLNGGSSGCQDNGCLGSDTSCSCKGVCDGEVRSVECTLDGNEFSCVCYVEGSPIATCSDPSNTCDLEAGCCAFYFGEGV